MGRLGFGIFVHFLGGGSPEEYNRLVDQVDAEGLASDLEEAGAGHLIFTIGQNSGYFCAPNAVYDSIVGHTPSHLSRRDLIADLYEALSRRGISLFAYLPSGAPEEDGQARQRLKYDDGAPRRAVFQRNWEAVVREWSERWGHKIAGWYFDGVYDPDGMYHHPDEPNFGSFAGAARAGNPDAIVCFNNGRGPQQSVSHSEDFAAGEIWQPGQPLPECSVDGKTAGHGYTVTWHLNTFLAGNFGGYGVPPGPRFSDEYTIAYTQRQLDAGGAITWDVPVAEWFNGRLRHDLTPQLRALNSALNSNNVNLTLKRPVLASSALESAENPARDDPSSFWASHSDDEHPYWQVDLRLPYNLCRVEVVLGPRGAPAGGVRVAGSTDVELSTALVVGELPPGMPVANRTWTIALSQPSSPIRFLRVSGLGGPLSLAVVRTYGTYVPPNDVAFNKPASASSGADPSLGNDGRDDTTWSAEEGDGGAWWQVDLGQPYEVSSVEFLARQHCCADSERQCFEFRGSNQEDGRDYVVLASQLQPPVLFPAGGMWTAPVPRKEVVRYIRVVKTDETPLAVCQIRVNGRVPSPTFPASDGCPAFASSRFSADNVPSRAATDVVVQGQLKWASAAGDLLPWWQVDLGAPLRLTAVQLAARQDGCDQDFCRRNFAFYGSNDPLFLTHDILASQGESSFPHQGTWAAPVTLAGQYRYVRLVKTDRMHMNLAAVRVTAFGQQRAPVDLALGKLATASSAFSDGVPPSCGNDGSRASIWASAIGDPSPWWQVDLGRTYVLTRVNLTARQDGDQPGARKLFEVRGSVDPGMADSVLLAAAGDQPFPARGTWEKRISEERLVRYVRVAKVDCMHFNFAAVSVFGAEPLPRDVTRGCRATASSQWSDQLAPLSALDGNPDTFYSSALEDPHPWWQVDLVQQYRLVGIELTPRLDMDQPDARRNFEIRASNVDDGSSSVLLGQQGPDPFPSKGLWTLAITEPTPYRFVRISRATPNLNFGDLKAYSDQ